jgi:cysteinyl-tRNA synthetase
LVSEELLDKDNAAKDPWGQPWHIECSARDVTVLSDGKDRIAGTGDDIRVPPT